MKTPKILSINKHLTSSNGELSVLNLNPDEIPFHIKRIFWIKSGAKIINRGNHAHKIAEHFIIALQGTVKITLIDVNGIVTEYVLNNDRQGLYVPPNYWRILDFKKNTIQLVLSSTNYEITDYLNSLEDFCYFWKTQNSLINDPSDS